MSEHIKRSHNKSLLIYHLVCSAKYRKKVFSKIEGTDQEIKNVCLEIEQRYDIHFLEIGVDQDHVHFLIQSVPVFSPTNIAKMVKSITAREMFKRIPKIKTMLWGGEFWTKGYYISTVGQQSNEIGVKNYIENQDLQYKQIYLSQPTLFEGF